MLQLIKRVCVCVCVCGVVCVCVCVFIGYDALVYHHGYVTVLLKYFMFTPCMCHVSVY